MIVQKKFAACTLLSAVALTGCPAGGRPPVGRPPPGPSASPQVARAAVAYVIDGDTIIVTARARRTRIRLLGLDAPEDTRRHGCFGAQATAWLRRLLPAGTVIWVAVDPRRADPYGRALGYVWRADGMFVNQALIRRGYATTLFLPPAGPFRGEFAAAEARARAVGAGLWRACPSPA